MARFCYYIPVDQFTERGYIPSVVTENEPGHAPLWGRDDWVAPWIWGQTYKDACATAARANAELGLSETDIAEIVASSMRMTPG